MKEKHRYHKEIIAWANGETLQLKHINRPENSWVDLEEAFEMTPPFNNPSYSWRIKPKTLKCRLAYMKSHDGSLYIDVQNSTSNRIIEKENNFVGWIDENWLEFTVPD